MMLCKLSLSNIKKSFKDYAIYFITLILAVCIFYVFNSIDSQTAMLAVSNSTRNMMELLTEIISAASVFVSCVLGFLIIYASRFLIKKRKKEFGIYMLLGMSKRKISILLLIETIIIGLISLGIGLGIGILISQVTSIFVAKLFEANMASFAFNFSAKALIKTCIYYLIIYLVVMVFNTIIISKCKLIDLLQASRKTEVVKLKNPILCVILCLLSCTILGFAYYIVLSKNITLFNNPISIFVPIGMGVVGTLGFFYSCSGLFLRLISRFKNVYYKSLNTFIYKQISSKINTMVISVSIICIMLFFTICLLSSCFSLNNYMTNALKKNAPADFQLEYYTEDHLEPVDFESRFAKAGILDDIKEYVVFNTYEVDGFTYGISLGKNANNVKKQYPFVDYSFLVSVVPISEYNKYKDILHLDDIKLNDNQLAIVCNYECNLYEDALKMDKNYVINNYNLTSVSNKVIDGFITIGGNAQNMGYFVVPDYVLEGLTPSESSIIVNFKTDNEDEITRLSSIIPSEVFTDECFYTNIVEIRANSIGLGAMAVFMGLYLGTIFLMSSAAILALKELSDTIDDKDKYTVLRNIGTDEKMINKALFKQTIIFFLLPLSVAIVHSFFGIKFCLYMLETVGMSNIVTGIIVTSSILLLIYGGYFLVTYYCKKNIIKSDR